MRHPSSSGAEVEKGESGWSLVGVWTFWINMDHHWWITDHYHSWYIMVIMVVTVIILLLLETLRFGPTQLLGTLATVALTMTIFLCCCACRTSSWHRIWHSSPESLRCSKVDHWLCSALISCKALAAGYRRIFCAFLIWAALLHCCILQSQCQIVPRKPWRRFQTPRWRAW